VTTDVRSLVSRAQAGEADALERLYALHAPAIRAYLGRLVGRREDADDLTAETFARMVEAIGAFRLEAAPFSAWLYRIAAHLAADHFRRSARPLPMPESARRTAPSAEEEAFRSLERERVVRMLARLPGDQGRVVALRVLLGRSTAEAAAALDRSEGAAKLLHHRALVSLAPRLAA
jgi:RNA polymerase sigma-70 factor (ECF subfamily)